MIWLVFLHCPVLQLGPDSDHCGSCSVQYPTGASEAALQHRNAMMEASPGLALGDLRIVMYLMYPAPLYRFAIIHNVHSHMYAAKNLHTFIIYRLVCDMFHTLYVDTYCLQIG